MTVGIVGTGAAERSGWERPGSSFPAFFSLASQTAQVDVANFEQRVPGGQRDSFAQRLAHSPPRRHDAMMSLASTQNEILRRAISEQSEVAAEDDEMGSDTHAPM